jgi:hypothetical protein
MVTKRVQKTDFIGEASLIQINPPNANSIELVGCPSWGSGGLKLGLPSQDGYITVLTLRAIPTDLFGTRS